MSTRCLPGSRGQAIVQKLRRSTEARVIHRLAQLALAVTILLTAKLIDRPKGWSR